jgi:hypothetical protein
MSLQLFSVPSSTLTTTNLFAGLRSIFTTKNAVLSIKESLPPVKKFKNGAMFTFQIRSRSKRSSRPLKIKLKIKLHRTFLT